MFIESSKAGVLAGIALWVMLSPFVQASADPEMGAARWVSSTAFYENANACMWAGIPKEVCQSAYRSAYRQHVRVAPAYRDQAACEAAFARDECFVSASSDLWSPWLAGFSLITQAQLPAFSMSEYRLSHEQMANLNKSWWQHLQGSSQTLEPKTQVRHFSEPLYWESDRQGGLRLTTLRDKSRNDPAFVDATGKPTADASQATPGPREQARLFEPRRLIDVMNPLVELE
jgi:uncharacterized protein YgiB involved in biofilm formation